MDEKTASRILDNAFQLWLEPEVKRRIAHGRMTQSERVRAIQVVFTLEADPVVRLNDEIRGAITGHVSRKVSTGEAVTLRDFRDIKSIELTSEDPNAGHFTALVHDGRWCIFFDFRYNATRAHAQLQAADQFLAAATSAIDLGHAIAAIDNLFDAVQMMAKSYLLTTGDQRALTAKTHSFIETGYNQQAKLGNVDHTSARLLNRLAALRPKVRYALEPDHVSPSDLAAMLSDAKAMRDTLERRRPKRAQ